MKTQKNVLRFLTKEEIEKIVDDTAQKVVHYLLNKLAFSQPETKDLNEPFGIQVTKEFLEAWVAQACQMKRVGAGSYPIDVYRENEFGVDIKAVSAEVDQDGKFTRGVSGESSLGRIFLMVILIWIHCLPMKTKKVF